MEVCSSQQFMWGVFRQNESINEMVLKKPTTMPSSNKKTRHIYESLHSV